MDKDEIDEIEALEDEISAMEERLKRYREALEMIVKETDAHTMHGIAATALNDAYRWN